MLSCGFLRVQKLAHGARQKKRYLTINGKVERQMRAWTYVPACLTVLNGFVRLKSSKGWLTTYYVYVSLCFLDNITVVSTQAFRQDDPCLQRTRIYQM